MLNHEDIKIIETNCGKFWALLYDHDEIKRIPKTMAHDIDDATMILFIYLEAYNKGFRNGVESGKREHARALRNLVSFGQEQNRTL